MILDLNYELPDTLVGCSSDQLARFIFYEPVVKLSKVLFLMHIRWNFRDASNLLSASFPDTIFSILAKFFVERIDALREENRFHYLSDRENWLSNSNFDSWSAFDAQRFDFGHDEALADFFPHGRS